MKKKLSNLKLRTKIEAFVVACVFLSLIVTSSFATNNVIKMPSGSTAGSILGKDIICTEDGTTYLPTASNLQAAIWHQNVTDGGTITIGADIEITTPIRLVNNTALDFQSNTMTLTDSAGFHMIQLGDGTNWVTNIEIRNGIFDGNRANQAGLYHCIYAQDKCQRINIHDNYFTGWYGKAIAIEGGAGAGNCYYISVCNNMMGDFEQGVDADGIDFDQVQHGVIEKNIIKEAGDDGIDIGAGGNVEVIGNVVRDCVNGIELYATKATVVGNICDKLDYYGIVLDSCKVTTVSGNYIYSAGHHGIRMLFAVSCSVVGNTLWRCSSTSNNAYDSIHLENKGSDPCVNNTIIGNTILEDDTNKAKYGINESDSDQDYNIILGNTINGPVTGAINKSGAHSLMGYNIGYETVFPTNNVTTFQAGYAWFNTATNVLNVYNGTAWVTTTFT